MVPPAFFRRANSSCVAGRATDPATCTNQFRAQTDDSRPSPESTISAAHAPVAVLPSIAGLLLHSRTPSAVHIDSNGPRAHLSIDSGSLAQTRGAPGLLRMASVSSTGDSAHRRASACRRSSGPCVDNRRSAESSSATPMGCRWDLYEPSCSNGPEFVLMVNADRLCGKIVHN